MARALRRLISAARTGAGLVRGAARSGVRSWRTAARKGGAGASGLTALTDLSLVNSAGDTLLAVALASTLFFAEPEHAARGRVGLYLVTTVAPFAVIAPVLGPLMDRYAHGRRIALAVTLVARGMLAWALASHTGGLALYPLALLSLVASKAFGVARSAVVPRVATRGSSLVRVNSRLQITSTATSVVAAPLAAGISYLAGYPWVLHLDTPVYLFGALLAARLPGHVDAPAGAPARGLGAAIVGADRGLREPAADHPDADAPLAFWLRDREPAADPESPPAPPRPATPRPATPGPATPRPARSGRPRVRGRDPLGLGNLPAALRGMLPLRALVGFLTFFLAFLLRTHHGGTVWLGLLAASAAAGSGLGLLVGRALSTRRPEGLVSGGLLAAAVGCIVGAAAYSRSIGLLVALLALTAWTAGKLGLDAIIQRDVDEAVRTSAFGRSETSLQLAWVLGGALGLLPLSGTLGFSIASVGMLAALALEVRGARARRRRTQAELAGGAQGAR
jgi:MFS family permease